MTTQTHDDDLDDDDSGSKGDRNWRRMEQRLKALETENASLKGVARKGAFTEAGFDPTQGVGKAIAALYDGELTTEAIRKFAKTEYGLEPGDTAPAAPSPQDVLADVIAAGQQATGKLAAASKPIPAPGSDQAKIDTLHKLDVPGNPVTDQELGLRLEALREAHGIPTS